MEETKCYCGHTTYCDCGPEEPKQETLEEAVEKYAEIYRCPATNENEYCRHDIISAINFGAKWQQERSYSEEEVGEILYKAFGEYGKHYSIMLDGAFIDRLFKQFKKK